MSSVVSILVLTVCWAGPCPGAVWIQSDSAAFAAGTCESTSVTGAGVALGRHPRKTAADARMNDDVTTLDQDHPAVAITGEGGGLTVWVDGRNGNNDIYLQRFDESGTASGGNLAVNDDSSGAEQKEPAVTVNDSGSAVVVWADSRGGDFDIYLQRYDAAGGALGTNTRINTDSDGTEQSAPAVRMDSSGAFQVVWTDARNGNYDVYGQYFGNDGQPSGGNILVSDGGGSETQARPDVWLDASGYGLVVWEDYRSGTDWDIRARVLLYGVPVDTSYPLSDDPDGYDQRNPALDVRDGHFVAVWEDNRLGPVRIFGQRGSTSAGLSGGNSVIDDDTGLKDKINPGVAVNGDGSFTAIWQDLRNESTGGYQLWGQYMTGAGLPVKGNFRVDDNNENGGRWATMSPAVAGAGDTAFTAVWMDKRSGDRDIYRAVFDASICLDAGTYISAVYNTAYEYTEYQTIAWRNAGADSLLWQVRAAHDSFSIGDSVFTGPDGSAGSWYRVPGESLYAGLHGNRYVQYRVSFSPDDSSRSPVLDSVALTWGGTDPVTWGGLWARQEGAAVTITWRTVSQQWTMGFNVFGKMADETAFRKLNGTLVPGCGTCLEPRIYEFSVEPSPGLWRYAVQEVSTDGLVSWSDTLDVPVAEAKATGFADGRTPSEDDDIGLRWYSVHGYPVRAGQAVRPSGIYLNVDRSGKVIKKIIQLQ